MASKFGFERSPGTKLDYGRILEQDKMYFGDIIAAVKFDYDIIGLFSLEELYNRKYNLYDRKNNRQKFIYPDTNVLGQGFSLKIKESLERSNEFIGIKETSQKKEIFLKRTDALDFFNLRQDVLKNMKDVSLRNFETVMIKGTGLSEETDKDGIPKLKEEGKIPDDYILSDKNFKNTNPYDKRKRIFYLRVFNPKKRDTGIRREYIDTNGVVNPIDLKNFYTSFLRGRDSSYFDNFYNTGQLPRISDPNLFLKILQIKENTKIDSDVLCYTYDETKKDCCLIPNIVIDSKFNKVTEVNRTLERGRPGGMFSQAYDPYAKSRICGNNNFQIGDTVIGYLNEGIYKSLGKDVLEKKYSNERDLFIKKVSSKDFNKLKKDYPRPSLSLIVYREGSTFVPFSSKLPSSIDYIDAFFNTLTKLSVIKVNNNSFKKFRKELITELSQFIFLHYYQNMIIQNNRRGIEAFNKLNMGKIYNYSIQRRNIDSLLQYYDKDIIMILISSIMKSDNFYSNLSELFSNPIILYGDQTDREFPNLRYISYFINCEKAEQCERVIRVGDPEEDSNQNFTFPYLKMKGTEEYVMYYNKELEFFSNIRL